MTLFTKYRIEIKYGLMTFMLLAALFALEQSETLGGLNSLMVDFFNLMVDLGFIGIMIVALVSNSSVLVHLPYTVPLLSLALGGASLENMLLMGLAAGIGAALGEVISYYMAVKILSLNPGLEKSELFQWIKRVMNLHPRMAPLLVFIWAVTPIPDDTVIIPLATVRYGISRILVPLFTGKIIHTVVTAAIFFYFTAWSAERVSVTVQVDFALGILILFVMLILYQVEKNSAEPVLVAEAV